MAQQINLFSPLLLSRRQVFTARTMAVALVVFLVLVALMTWLGVTTLKQSAETTRRQLTERATEKARLGEAIQGKNTADGSSRDQQAREAQTLGAEVKVLRGVLAEMQQGLVSADTGHAARLRLVAQTIPAGAWISEMVTDNGALSLSGATTAPAELNDWMQRLAQHPLMTEQQFGNVKVERQANHEPTRWGFTLASQPRVAASAPVAGGGRP